MDIFGIAAEDYYNSAKHANIVVKSKTMEDDVIPVHYLFRNKDKMPHIEKVAIENCVGEVLEIGGCVGSHALEIQRETTIDMLEISQACVNIASKRGVANCINADIFNYTPSKKYDTILLLMNGIGLTGSVQMLREFAKKTLDWLKPDGKIIFDSTNIAYCYEEEPTNEQRELNGKYYGQVEFQMSYGDNTGEWFSWLYLDKMAAAKLFEQLNVKFEVLCSEGDHYLASISNY